MLRHEELLGEMRANLRTEMVRDVYTSILKFTDEDVRAVGVRTLAVAGGLQDDVEGTRRMGRELRGGCKESKAVVVRNAVHTWDLQLPGLFAQGVKAWIEGWELPVEFEELKS